MGPHNAYWTPYIGALFLSSLFGTLIGMTGILRSATADLSTTVTWALMTSVICWGCSIKQQRLPWLAERLYRARRCHDPDEYYLRDRTARLDGVPSLWQHCRRRRADKSALLRAGGLLGHGAGAGGQKRCIAGAVVLVLGIILLVLGIKTQKMGKKIFGIVFAVTGLLGILSLTGVPYLEVGIPGILSLYFDVFSGGVQALVFSLLTMVYIGNACPPPEEV